MTAQNLILAIIVLQVLDAASTVYFLRNTMLVEANPVLAKLFEVADPLIVLLVLKGAFAVGIWYWQYLFPVEALWLVAAVYVAVVINNLRLIRKAQG